MQADIRVEGGDSASQYISLSQWLKTERALAGAVNLERSRPGEGEMGGAFDVLVVALGSGGSAVALANSLATWLQMRRSDVTITIKTKLGTVKIDARRIKDADAVPMLHKVLGITDGPLRTRLRTIKGNSHRHFSVQRYSVYAVARRPKQFAWISRRASRPQPVPMAAGSNHRTARP